MEALVATITREIIELRPRVLVTFRIQTTSGLYTYPVTIENQGNDTANEALTRRELSKILQEVLEALGPA
jgi:hypothetical protein